MRPGRLVQSDAAGIEGVSREKLFSHAGMDLLCTVQIYSLPFFDVITQQGQFRAFSILYCCHKPAKDLLFAFFIHFPLEMVILLHYINTESDFL